MDFQVAGLASGFDWSSLVDQLMEIERIPQQRMRTTQTENTSKISALDTLSSKLTDLESTLGSFESESLYNAKNTSLSDETLDITASASTSASVGSYSFNVTQLATTTKRVGTSDVGGTMGDESTVLTNLHLNEDITEGTFSINGQDITVAETDTLQDVFDAISIATSGVVSASYDSGEDKITLTSSSGQLELGSDSDDSNFLSAMRLDQLEVVDAGGGSSSITSTVDLGVVDLNDTITDSGISSGSPITGSGTLIINGVSIDFDADTESMSSLMASINESDANVTMTYDSAADQFKIVNNETGAYDMHISDSGNGMLAALGLDGAADVGDDMEYSIDGGSTLSSRSNSISSDSHGIDGLTVTASETGTQTIGISRDSSGLEEAINSFILDFNDVQDYILEQTKVEVEDDEVETSTLSGNREVSSIDSKLRSFAFSAIEGMSGDLFRLEHLGIDFISGTSKLEVKDSDALNSALEGDLSTLQTFFMDGDTSFAARMKDLVENFTADDGVLDVQTETLTNQNQNIDDQIAEMERRLEFQRSALEAGFIAMETAQSNINNQSAALSSIIT
ncbi:flagellar filament capping protein FliD [Puniceicoccaceae bacterium K14]|nr:flagellar filament capping protein FliD [Puniceicoccaceae bacterium K14]